MFSWWMKAERVLLRWGGAAPQKVERHTPLLIFLLKLPLMMHVHE